MTVKILIQILLFLGCPSYSAPHIAKAVAKYSTKRNLDPVLIVSVIKHESNFKRKSKSRTNDYGLMQIHCPRQDYMWWCKRRERLFKIRRNIQVGTYIMHLKRNRCKHKKGHWIKCYNPGSKSYARRVLKITNKIREKFKLQNNVRMLE